MKNITIIGSGSFGCALAYILQNNNNVKIWSYTKEECNSINNKHECLFLPSIKLKEVALNKNKIKIDSRTIIQKIRSDTLAEMTIKLVKTKNLFYNCTLTLYTKNPIKLTSDQSMNSIDYNTIILEKDHISINTNLCTTINRKDFSIKERDTNKNEYYRTTLNLNKMQGDIKIISKSMRIMREIDLAISDSIR